MNSHDYSASGTYFITICTHLGQSYFGNILNGKMILSGTGLIAYKIWHEIPEHFSFISLDAFVVMPNHVHGIIIIQSPTAVGTLHATSQKQQSATHVGTLHTNDALHSPVGTLHAKSLQSVQNEFMSHISPKQWSLPTVLRSYKSAVSKNVHLFDHGFSWQPRYYDHLIRSDKEMERIKKYIIYNPINWRP